MSGPVERADVAVLGGGPAGYVLGPRATDLVAEGALAVQLGATADDLAWTTHAPPTIPEAMLEAALGFRGGTIHAQTR